MLLIVDIYFINVIGEVFLWKCKGVNWNELFMKMRKFKWVGLWLVRV